MTYLKSFMALSLILFQIFLPPFTNNSVYNPHVAEMLSAANPHRWMKWIRALSGADPIQTTDGMEKILTRSSLVMFEPDAKPSAFDYLIEELVSLGFVEGQDFQIHNYAYPYGDRYPERNWKNIILSFPGDDPDLKNERVLFVAHMDSFSDNEYVIAPGADDNASGTAGLLEAASILQHYRFERTIDLIWFSGEEKSRIGSTSFVEDYADWLPNIVGVLNMDMFAFDGDGDRCFEVHAGTLPGSQEIGNLIGSVIDVYDLDLTYDFLDDEFAYTFSDHNPFWRKGVPGVLMMENFFYHPGETCGKSDRNYNYHRTTDTIRYINSDTGFSILQASIAAVAHLAQPLGPCLQGTFEIDINENSPQLELGWQSLDEAEK